MATAVIADVLRASRARRDPSPSRMPARLSIPTSGTP